MKISFKEWCLIVLIAVLCFFFWHQFEYQRYASVDLSIDKREAVLKAERYLSSLGFDTRGYSKAVVFNTDSSTDIYLQKTIGPEEEERLFKQHNYELFSWRVRFFRQFQKEEFFVRVSAKTGQILGLNHLIKDTDAREDLGKERALHKAEQFLRDNYGLNLQEYEFYEEQVKRYEHRIDYSFSWQKKGVYIPWKDEKGVGKLLTGATVAGSEITGFYKNSFNVPENFLRYLERQLINSEYLYNLYYIFFLFLLFYSVFILFKRRNTLVFRICKRTFFYLAVFLVAINFASIFNDIQEFIITFPTSTSLWPFIVIGLLKSIVGLVMLSAVFLLPGLAGESMRQESFPDKKHSSFIYYIKSSFYSRSVTRSIILGYFFFFIILGFQAQIFHFGQKYLGVWREWYRLSQFSSAYLPFLSFFVIGTNAAFCEEIVFRVFAISLSKKFLKNTALSVALASLVWGLGHSGYSIFPFWFRNAEVTLLGFLLGFIFLRYGIITAITTHYLLDIFLGAAPYILGRSSSFIFISSIFIYIIPLLFAIISYCINKEEKEKENYAFLDANQKYNLNILKDFIAHQKDKGLDPKVVKQELSSHGWDADLVELAMGE